MSSAVLRWTFGPFRWILLMPACGAVLRRWPCRPKPLMCCTTWYNTPTAWSPKSNPGCRLTPDGSHRCGRACGDWRPAQGPGRHGVAPLHRHRAAPGLSLPGACDRGRRFRVYRCSSFASCHSDTCSPAASGRTRGHVAAPGGGRARARQGQCQVVWVTGEAGIGKTTVVEAFRAAVATDPAVWLAAGQCVEHYGTGEAYLPVLETLGALSWHGRRAPGDAAAAACTHLAGADALAATTAHRAAARRTSGGDAGAHAARVCRSGGHADGGDASGPDPRRFALE